MLSIVICHAPEDAEIARDLAGFLERGTGARVFVDEGRTEPTSELIAKVNEGRMADVVLALLSPASAPPRWPLRAWQDAFWHKPAEANVAVATLLLAKCQFPDLLRRKGPWFELSSGRLAAFRAVKRWMLGLRAIEEAPFVPAEPPYPVSGAAVERLADLLADRPGETTVADPGTALAFAARHAGDFEAVFWARLDGSLNALAGDLAAQAGLPTESPREARLESLRRLSADHRFLVLLDNALDDPLGIYEPGGLSSVLSVDSAPLPPPVDLTDDEARAASTLAVCGGFASAMLISAVAGLEPERGDAALAALAARGLVLRPDTRFPRWLVLCRADSDPQLAVRHASLAARGDDFGAARHAFWRMRAAGHRQAGADAGRRAVSLAISAGRFPEAMEVLEVLHRDADAHADEETLNYAVREQCRILDRWEMVDESAVLRRAAGAYCGTQQGFDW